MDSKGGEKHKEIARQKTFGLDELTKVFGQLAIADLKTGSQNKFWVGSENS